MCSRLAIRAIFGCSMRGWNRQARTRHEEDGKVKEQKHTNHILVRMVGIPGQVEHASEKQMTGGQQNRTKTRR